jgi:hypothetical protein
MISVVLQKNLKRQQKFIFDRSSAKVYFRPIINKSLFSADHREGHRAPVQEGGHGPDGRVQGQI